MNKFFPARKQIFLSLGTIGFVYVLGTFFLSEGAISNKINGVIFFVFYWTALLFTLTHLTYIEITAEGVLQDVCMFVRRHEAPINRITKIARSSMYGGIEGYGSQLWIYFLDKNEEEKGFNIYTTAYEQAEINRLVIELYKRNPKIAFDRYFQEVLAKAGNEKELINLAKRQNREQIRQAFQWQNFVKYALLIAGIMLAAEHLPKLLKAIFSVGANVP